MKCGISGKEAGLLGLLLVMLACGGGDDGMGPEVDPGESLPGTVSIDNRTPWDVEVAWLWVGEGWRGRRIGSTVWPRQTSTERC